MGDISLNKVTRKEKDIFYNLNKLFAYDFSELNKMDINDDGLYQQLQDDDKIIGLIDIYYKLEKIYAACGKY